MKLLALFHSDRSDWEVQSSW